MRALPAVNLKERVMHSIVLEHRFETAHRLPHLEGSAKCANIHGHSWTARWTFASQQLEGDGTVTEFGAAKAMLRDWVDTNLDHALMLGQHDDLLPLLLGRVKVYVLGTGLAAGIDWPTVEGTALLLHRVAETLDVGGARVEVSSVEVQETLTNRATYAPATIPTPTPASPCGSGFATTSGRC